MKLSNTVAIVTGASSGIGRVTALALAERGATVVLASRNQTGLDETASHVVARGGEALVCPTDVTCFEQIEALVGTTLARWGRVDVLVSNSGQYLRAPVREVSLPLLEQSLRVNFLGGAAAVLAVLPHMLERRSGHIVLVSSMDARLGLSPDAPYVAAKAALTGFGDVLRKELRGSGVGITTVLPGRVDTPMIADLKFHWISAKISPESVARAIVHAIERQRSEVILPPQAWLLYLANTLSPALADWLARTFHLEGWKE